jgi:DNA polymerase-3 subunit epsilon
MSKTQQEAAYRAREILHNKPVYLDTETTGMKDNDQVIEIAVLDHDGSKMVDSLVKPLQPIPSDATRIHGITNRDVAGAPAWAEVWAQVEHAIQGRRVGIYNKEFDLRIIQQTHKMHWMTWKTPQGTTFFDIMALYARFKGDWNSRAGDYRWHSLENAGIQCGLALPNTHRAFEDTLLTRALLKHMADFQAR